MQHYLTYQHSVQKFFRDHRDKFDGVIIPLSIATSFPDGTFGFIRALCSDRTEKSYAIDPRNAMFQKKWNRASVRSPHRKMAATLGTVYTEKGLVQPLLPSDFDDDAALDLHVKQVIEMQLKFNSQTEDIRKLEKYKKLLGLDGLGTMGSPHFLIPPYYEFSAVNDPWFAVSQRCTEKALLYCNGIPVWPVLHFQTWGSVEWNRISEWLESIGIKNVWFYANNFKEHEAPDTELKAYRNAVELVGSKLNSLTLFGGYFSILMSYFGLKGFSNGIGYGEWRDSGYHRGGSAATRVYVLKLHRYLDSAAAQSLVENDPEYFGGDSEILAGYVASETSLVNMSLAESLDHFMECRQQELEFVAKRPIKDALNELNETLSHLRSLGTLYLEKYGASLKSWQDVISI